MLYDRHIHALKRVIRHYSKGFVSFSNKLLASSRSFDSTVKSQYQFCQFVCTHLWAGSSVILIYYSQYVRSKYSTSHKLVNGEHDIMPVGNHMLMVMVARVDLKNNAENKHTIASAWSSLTSPSAHEGSSAGIQDPECVCRQSWGSANVRGHTVWHPQTLLPALPPREVLRPAGFQANSSGVCLATRYVISSYNTW